MVICYTPRPRLQPQEEVVAVVTWKKKVVSEHPDNEALQQRGAFKDIPRYLDYVSVSRWIGCRNFCGNTGKCLKWTPYVSISSLVDTDQLSERHKRRRELRSAQLRRVILCFILVMTYPSDKNCHNMREHCFIPGDRRVIRPRLRRHALS